MEDDIDHYWQLYHCKNKIVKITNSIVSTVIMTATWYATYTN